jgi:hypothetical protein
MKKLVLIIAFSIFSIISNAFVVTVQKSDGIKGIPVKIKVLVDGIPRTIGQDNFQDISIKDFETTLLQEALVKIIAKIGNIEISKDQKIQKAKIFTIKPEGSGYVIK